MTRLLTLALLALAALLLGAADAMAVMVRPEAYVEGPMIRLVDVLVDAGEHGELVVAASPAPGEEMSLPYASIAGVARKAGMEGDLPTAGYVRVTRLATAVSNAAIEDSLIRRIAERGAAGRYVIRLTGHRGALFVPVDADPHDIRVESLSLDDNSGRFSARLLTPGDGGMTNRVEVSGIAESVREIPVLARSLSAGETIAAHDVIWTDMAERRINRTMVTEISQLEGKEAVRPMREGAPIRISDVRAPVLVKRGSIVTIVISFSGMSLSATGKAMQDGARGDTIRLVNLSTSRTVEAEVIGPDRARALTYMTVSDAR